jgi:hypothetical protein
MLRAGGWRPDLHTVNVEFNAKQNNSSALLIKNRQEVIDAKGRL